MSSPFTRGVVVVITSMSAAAITASLSGSFDSSSTLIVSTGSSISSSEFSSIVNVDLTRGVVASVGEAAANEVPKSTKIRLKF